MSNILHHSFYSRGGGVRSSRLTPGYRALAPPGLLKEVVCHICGHFVLTTNYKLLTIFVPRTFSPSFSPLVTTMWMPSLRPVVMARRS